MFTGIVESLGTISSIETQGTNRVFWIESPISAGLKIDQSVSHNGVCLTVEETTSTSHRVTAIGETLEKTSLGAWTKGDSINLEQCLPMNGRLDGHLVQGHVDTTGTCTAITRKDGSWEFVISFDPAFSAMVIEKGSICLNGISLTIFNVTKNSFTVAIIPYTYEHTNMATLKQEQRVNLEFDMIGKYVHRFMELRQDAINV